MLSEADQDGDGKVTYEGQKKYKCLKVHCFAISSYSIPIIVPIWCNERKWYYLQRSHLFEDYILDTR